MSYLVQPGEKLVWWGQPSRILYAKYALLMLGLNSVVYVGLLSFVASRADPQSVSLSAVTIGVWALSLLVSSGPIVGTLAWHWSCAGRTLYLLTTERAIRYEPRWMSGYKIVEARPEDLEGGLVFDALWNNKQVRRLKEETLAPKLAERLKHRDGRIRRQAIVTAAALAKQNRIPFSVLVDALWSEDRFIRKQAAVGLGKLRKDGRLAVRDLRRLVFDEDRAVSQAALHSLEAITRAA
ncbi:MAG TPA: HEAT repeat domain-containing protein [Pirellulaceae bacterium]|nr:HEAT repeat domain-containing protein [Pirellulaceae bacterium]